MSKYWTKAFWSGAAERAVKTLGQALVAYLGTVAVGLFEIDPLALVSVLGLAVLSSLATSLASPEFVAGTPDEASRPYSTPL